MTALPRRGRTRETCAVERIGVISDIHGNALALDAALAELERERVDRLICLGDVAVGPQPHESLDRVRSLGCPVIMGNWDAWFVDGLPEATSEVEERLFEIHRWWAGSLPERDREFLKTFQQRLEIELDGTPIVFFHGSPRSFDDWLVASTPDDEVDRMIEGFDAPLLVGGHTHMQMVRRFRDSLIVNPGSIGLPFLEWSRDVVRIAPWAEFAILGADGGRLALDLRRTPFAVAEHLKIARESGMPHAEWWAESWDRPRSVAQRA